MRSSRQRIQAFTLIELSIVLVVIGLLVGGVLVGRDLIASATIRAQIAQIDQIKTAAYTFRTKFNAFPGDIALNEAIRLGLTTSGCTGLQGGRDGNGLIEGGTGGFDLRSTFGETALFWNDLSSAIGGRLVSGSFTTATCAGGFDIPSTGLASYLPLAKTDRQNSYVYLFPYNGKNHLGVARFESSYQGFNEIYWFVASGSAFSVRQAYNIDTKIDDGLATTGSVKAEMSFHQLFSVNAMVDFSASAPTGSTGVCFLTPSNRYAISYLNGSEANCDLSFSF